MWNPLKRNREDCGRFLDALEERADVAALEPALQAHAQTCEDCRTAAEDLLAARELLSALPSQAKAARPWFAPRVMAAIAARESELKTSLEAWTAVPKLAARLTWVTALVLLVASAWLIERPKSFSPTRPADSVFENVPQQSNDDVLVSWAGTAR